MKVGKERIWLLRGRVSVLQIIIIIIIKLHLSYSEKEEAESGCKGALKR